ncbi:nuclear transport factor 2 family protein [Streptomyces sp. NBC_00091]|uniref:nuclear transport factor 2 family protein n=1 Tax=Streptomyces sp. NBC_00091 TaxID=2975648 RepID=UPI00224D27A3|nr:nuclear transport factor 2 family protein [Streptomyces sp. NBC_00091]MCX5377396.1 nuclear transport factor 2 family protein [Streptomyces sp. NBC_00091]
MDFTAIATAFTNHYYSSFDAGGATRHGLATVYRPESMLAWEGRQVQGASDIIAALTKPELGTVKHAVTTVDSQPAPGGGVLVSVTGTLAVDNAHDKPMSFTETFNLQPIPGQPGGFFAYNQIFRLIFS